MQPKIVHLTVLGQHLEYATLSERETEGGRREMADRQREKKKITEKMAVRDRREE